MAGAPGLRESILLRDRGRPGAFRLVESEGLKEGGAVLKGSGVCHYICADNLGALSRDPSFTSPILSHAAVQFEEMGLVTREHDASVTSSKALGAHLDLEGLGVALAPARSWKARFFGSLEELGPDGEFDDLDQPYDVDKRFPEVPHKLLSEACWCTLLAGPWRYFDDGIFPLEARALLLGFQAAVSDREIRNARVLFLVDNMGARLAFARGRASDFRTLTCMRRMGAGCLSLGLRGSGRAPARGVDDDSDGAWGLEESGGRLAGAVGKPLLMTRIKHSPTDQDPKALDDLSDEAATEKHEESDGTSETAKVRARPARRARAPAAPQVRQARRPVEPSRLQGLGLLPLGSSAVQTQTEINYHEAVISWRARARELGEPLGAAAEVGASEARQLQEFFDRGENLSKGEKLAAGLERILPDFGRRGNFYLPRCYRALTGWRRRCPPRSRRPLASSIRSAIFWELCRANNWSAAVRALFMLVTYVRPSEPPKL
ncbi:unnamed protein product, partial [Prorocentrum cordatum]